MTMKAIVTAMALACGVGAASAADFARPVMPATVPASVVQTFSWTGIYVGAQAGYRWTDVDFRDPAYGPPIIKGRYDVDGFTLGLHAGASYQINMLVLGVVADVDWTDGSGSGKGRQGFDVVTGLGSANWQASLRGNAGIAFDRVQVYATGGWAWADYDFGYRYQGVTDRFSETLDGWTVGVGGAYAITNNLIARIEYRYTDLGSASGSIAKCCAPSPNRQVHDLTTDQINLGLSYKF